MFDPLGPVNVVRCNKPGCTDYSKATYVFVLEGPMGYNDGVETLRCTYHMAEHITRRDLTNKELETIQKVQ